MLSEQLEARRLMSVALEDGVLMIRGDPAGQTISVGVFWDWVSASDGIPYTPDGFFSAGQINSVVVSAGGSDQLLQAVHDLRRRGQRPATRRLRGRRAVRRRRH